MSTQPADESPTPNLDKAEAERFVRRQPSYSTTDDAAQRLASRRCTSSRDSSKQPSGDATSKLAWCGRPS
eukprot:6953527-Ditylum_brightwellii.AAC.1